MSVIAEIRIPSTDFELGRILPIEHSTAIELETLVPIGDATVPLFWVYNSAQDSFLETVQRYPSVSNAAVVDVFEDRTLFSIEWEAHHDLLIEGISETGARSCMPPPQAHRGSSNFDSPATTHSPNSTNTAKMHRSTWR